MDAQTLVEFSRPIDIAKLNRGEQHFTVTANADERGALARRFDLKGLDKLTAKVRLAPVAGGLIRLEADLDADVTQTCVVSLVPVKSHVQENFTLLYGEDGESDEVTLDGEAETIEPIHEGAIDIGEAVAQQLSLSLDPFPHAPGAKLAATQDAAPLPKASPFQALASIKNKNDSKD